jgi:hypothetical protein
MSKSGLNITRCKVRILFNNLPNRISRFLEPADCGRWDTSTRDHPRVVVHKPRAADLPDFIGLTTRQFLEVPLRARDDFHKRKVENIVPTHDFLWKVSAGFMYNNSFATLEDIDSGSGPNVASKVWQLLRRPPQILKPDIVLVAKDIDGPKRKNVLERPPVPR